MSHRVRACEGYPFLVVSVISYFRDSNETPECGLLLALVNVVAGLQQPMFFCLAGLVAV